jgi:DNA-binding transcriptional ArsR family regulator
MMAEDDMIEAMKALAHPLRWRILTALGGGERNVGEIETATGISQPGLSQQLGVLRKAGLVTTRKDAKLVFYSLAADELSEVGAAVFALAPAGIRAGVSRNAPAVQRPPASGAANFARIS